MYTLGSGLLCDDLGPTRNREVLVYTLGSGLFYTHLGPTRSREGLVFTLRSGLLCNHLGPTRSRISDFPDVRKFDYSSTFCPSLVP